MTPNLASVSVFCITAFMMIAVEGIPLPGGLPIQPIATEVITTLPPSENNNDNSNSNSPQTPHNYNPSQESGDTQVQDVNENCLEAEREKIPQAFRRIDSAIKMYRSVFKNLNESVYSIWGNCSTAADPNPVSKIL